LASVPEITLRFWRIGMSVIVLAVVVTALLFDFTNGFHDTANAMATSIATGALRPKVAVLLAGVLNLVGAFLSVQVAKAISSASPLAATNAPCARASGTRRSCRPRW
jgi:phosphate/sulfate permease